MLYFVFRYEKYNEKLLIANFCVDFKNIDLNIVNEMKSIFFKELDKSFFKVRFDKCTPREKEFMFAMANYLVLLQR